jgi:hypothetical protein
VKQRKRHWIWNVLIVVTLFLCSLAFTAHYKNWIRFKEDHIRIFSGIYYKELPYTSLDSVVLVQRIPSMERINGFSAWAKEKGVFRDSLHPGNKVYVYVDDLRQPKIKLVHQDSLILFLNMPDTTETRKVFEMLRNKIATAPPLEKAVN